MHDYLLDEFQSVFGKDNVVSDNQSDAIYTITVDRRIYTYDTHISVLFSPENRQFLCRLLVGSHRDTALMARGLMEENEYAIKVEKSS